MDLVVTLAPLAALLLMILLIRAHAKPSAQQPDASREHDDG